MSKYKRGNKVKIREDLVVDKDYGDDSFVDGMSYLLGEIVTIENVIDKERGIYEILEDDENYYWTNEMIERLVKSK
jgi:hypothetical protein